MTSLRVVLRQVVSARWPVVVLAAVLFLAAMAAAATPRWITSELDRAATHTIATSEANLTGHDRAATSARQMDWAAEQVVTTEPLVGRAYGEPRWRVATDEGLREGPGSHFVSLMMPSEFDEQVRAVRGKLPSTRVTGGGPEDSPTVEAVVTTQLADEVGLAVGDELEATGALPQSFDPGAPPTSPGVKVKITGMVEPVDPDWPGWRELSLTLKPAVGFDDIHYALLTQPGTIEPLLRAGGGALNADWTFPVAKNPAFTTDEATELVQAIRRTESTGTWFSNLDQVVGDHLSSRASAERVAALGVTSLAALLAVLLVLSLRLLGERRADALRLARTRGASYLTLSRLLVTEGLLVGIIPVAAGALTGFAITSGKVTTPDLVMPGAVLVAVIFGLPAIGCWLARSGATRRPEQQSLRPSPRRLVAEGGALALAAAALWLLSTRTASGEGVDPLVSLTPVLVAFAAGLLVFRVLPFVVVTVIGWTRRTRGAVPFISAARSGRTASAAVLPVIAIMVAVGLAALGGAVGTTADHSREVSSWSRVPGDVVVTTDTLHVNKDDVAGLVPDADAVAVAQELQTSQISTPSTENVSAEVLAVDARAWERVVAHAPDPVAPVRLLAPRDDGRIPVVLVGNPVAGIGASITITPSSGGEAISAMVSGIVPSFSGSGGSDALLIPDSAVQDIDQELEPSVVFLAGDVDVEKASEALKATTTYTRAHELAATDDDPLLAATTDLFAVALLLSAILAGGAAVLSLLITSRSRAFTLSVLRTLGLTDRQSTGLVIAEVVPSALLAAAVGVGVGSAVTTLAEGALDLSALTTTLNAGGPVVLDVASTALTAAGVVATVILAVGITVVASNRANLGSAMKVGDQHE